MIFRAFTLMVYPQEKPSMCDPKRSAEQGGNIFIVLRRSAEVPDTAV